MKSVLGLVAAGVMMMSSVAVAEEVESGLKEGANIGAFYVTKAAGAEEDGVSTGQNLCYRCKNGARPQVMVFTRSTDDKVVKLIQRLDKQLQKHEDKQLRAFVNMLGDSKEAAGDEVKKLAGQAKTKLVPFVVPNEFENGPDNYGLNPEAAVTVLLANNSKVVANYAVTDASELEIKTVMSQLKKLVE